MASENRLRPFVGEWFGNPAPLELSMNLCTRCPTYCFAALNGREKSGIDAKATCSHIVNVFRTGGNPTSITDQLLLRRHPIVFSNAVDPLFHKNLASTRAILPLLKSVGVPVIFQTRGTDNPKDFPPYLDVLPEGSILYCSLTARDEEIRRGAEPGSPSFEKRLEMMAMAAARGIPVVAALNPAVPMWMGDLESYFARIDEIMGPKGVAGSWWEVLHLSERQKRAVDERYPKGTLLPVVEEAIDAAAAKPFIHDPYWRQDLVTCMEERGWRWYNFNAPGDPFKNDLFDLWPNPFPTHHRLIQACREVAGEERHPVLVSFETWCSWVDPFREVLDLEVSRGDAWYFINQKNNVDQIERKMMPRTLSIEECLRFLWNHPQLGAQAIYGGYGFKALVGQIPGEDGEPVGFDPVLLREDDNTALGVFAPQRFEDDEPVFSTDPKDRVRVFEEIEEDAVMLAPFDPSDPTDPEATSGT